MVNTHKRKMILILLVILSIILGILVLSACNNIRYESYKLTPIGAVLESEKQIQKDIGYIFRDKYRLRTTSIIQIEESIRLTLYDTSKEILQRSLQNEGDKVIQVSLEDKNSRSQHLNVHTEGQKVVTEQAVTFLLYFTQRTYDPTIKAVKSLYTPRNFDLDATTQALLVINIDEFKTEYNLLVEEGYNEEELINLLAEKFIYYERSIR